MPDLTGSSFRTGVDMAAAGDTIPVSFTVQNRGGADPGNFQVQVLLAENNLFDSSAQVLATFTRASWSPTRRAGLLVAGRLQRDGAGGLGVGACRPRPAHRGRPGGARSRLVRQERRPSRRGLGAADGRHGDAAGATDLSQVDAGLYTETPGTLATRTRCRPTRSRSAARRATGS